MKNKNEVLFLALQSSDIKDSEKISFREEFGIKKEMHFFTISMTVPLQKCRENIAKGSIKSAPYRLSTHYYSCFLLASTLNLQIFFIKIGMYFYF